MSTELGNPNETNGADNPFGLPQKLRYIGEYNGGPIQSMPAIKDMVKHLGNVRAMEMKDDDVMIAAYRKCGTHWVWEMTNMLLNQTTQLDEHTKEFFMIDFVEADHFQNLKSPRVLNSHLHISQLPEQMAEKKVKIIHPIRNPKDTLVSLYYHMKHVTGVQEAFSFGTVVDAMVAGKQLRFEDQFSYLRQIQEFEKAHPGYPIMHIHYEDIQRDPASAVKKIAQFLDVPASDRFCEEIAEACHFDNMKSANDARKFPKLDESLGRKRPSTQSFYRKGKVGDWKNHFTVRDNEVMDAFIEREIAKGLNVTFKYE